MSSVEHKLAGASHCSVKSYSIGFLLSVLLTVIPFALVMYPSFSSLTTLYVIATFAVVQVLVQLGFFLHMNTRSDEGWNMIAFIFTAVIIAIVVVGSLWIMFHLNHNMSH